MQPKMSTTLFWLGRGVYGLDAVRGVWLHHRAFCGAITRCNHFETISEAIGKTGADRTYNAEAEIRLWFNSLGLPHLNTQSGLSEHQFDSLRALAKLRLIPFAGDCWQRRRLFRKPIPVFTYHAPFFDTASQPLQEQT